MISVGCAAWLLFGPWLLMHVSCSGGGPKSFHILLIPDGPQPRSLLHRISAVAFHRWSLWYVLPFLYLVTRQYCGGIGRDRA